MEESGDHNSTFSMAWRTFLHRTCPTCNRRLYTFGPCEHCGDGNIHLKIDWERTQPNWQTCTLKFSIIELDAKDGKRSYSHKRSSRKDLELIFRKKTGGDGRPAYEVLFIDRMKKLKTHRVHVREGEEFLLTHDEIKQLQKRRRRLWQKASNESLNETV